MQESHCLESVSTTPFTGFVAAAFHMGVSNGTAVLSEDKPSLVWVFFFPCFLSGWCLTVSWQSDGNPSSYKLSILCLCTYLFILEHPACLSQVAASFSCWAVEQ